MKILTLLREQIVNTLKPRQNCSHFTDDIFTCIFFDENACVSLKISLEFAHKVRINNIPTLVQIMAWRRPGHMPLSELMMVSLMTHIGVTRPQWVLNIVEWYFSIWLPSVCMTLQLRLKRNHNICLSIPVWSFFWLTVVTRSLFYRVRIIMNSIINFACLVWKARMIIAFYIWLQAYLLAQPIVGCSSYADRFAVGGSVQLRACSSVNILCYFAFILQRL